MSNHVILYITCKNNKEAILISDKLISSKLIACANIIKNVTSIFRWKKKLNKSKEVILLAKTSQKNVLQTPPLKKEIPKSCNFRLEFIVLVKFSPHEFGR